MEPVNHLIPQDSVMARFLPAMALDGSKRVYRADIRLRLPAMSWGLGAAIQGPGAA